ncbi:MFS transporter [Granulicella sp. 5B5]|nr:MFS transporter [Granulicella sp. 5B5]
MQTRLGAMLFLEYFIWGAWYVTVGTWLTLTRHFSGEQVALVAGTTAVGAMIAPFFVGLVADEMFATEKVLAALHLVGAVLLLGASLLTSFGAIYALLLLYCLCFMPTLALTNSLAFRQMRDPAVEFGPIRVLGTAGWIVAGLLVGYMRLESTQRPLQIACVVSLVMAAYCLTLPPTPPLAVTVRAEKKLFPREAFAVFRKRSTIVFVLASFLICIPLQFYYAFANLFLNEAGVKNAVGKMTGGQMSELVCMLLIPWFFRRLGVKYMLGLGMLAWVVRYVAFAYGNSGALMWMFWLGIVLHGICYDFFFVTGQIYIDRESPPTLRAATQSLITFITYGVGMFVGSWVSGAVVEHYSVQLAGGAVDHAWRPIWMFAAVAAGATLVMMLATFKDEPRVESSEVAAALPSGAEAL